jgi:pilus assembly protein CpaB
LKRSNRLILLIGLFLAVVAFVGVILLTNNGGSGTGTPATPTTAKIVVAAQDIPLGTTITALMVTTKDVALADKPADSFALPEAVIGKIVRTDVTSGGYISTSTFSAAASLVDVSQLLDAGLGAISVQVDQVSGVGTLVKPGDRVDVVLSMNDPVKNPIVVEKAPTKEGQPPSTVRNFATVNPLLNSTTVKVLVQNVQVVGTILPPPPAQQGAAAQGTTGTGTTNQAATTLNGQSQIVILALTAQQAELVRFTQLDGNLSLVLRSPKDKDAPAVKTTGITLRQLVDSYGVIPPKIILTEQP